MRQIFLSAIFIFGLALSSRLCVAKEVAFPISLDYQLLESLIIQSSYTGAEKTAQLINEGDGCITLTLSDPAFSGSSNVVNFSSKLFLRVGTPIGDNCFLPYEWAGSIEVDQIPRLENEAWELTFETVDTRLYSSDNKPVKSFDLIWDRIMPILNSYMQDFSVSLAPPVEDLKTFIIPLFTAEAQKEAERLLNSIRPGDMKIDSTGVTVTVKADVYEVQPAEKLGSDEELTESELESFMELWETWDSFLVYLVSILSDQPLTESEKQVLIDLLLDTRYKFVAHLTDQTIEKDFVREQFVEGWDQLSQIFRKHLLHDSSTSGFGYLSFITAVDALMILDELGPTFGIEVSRNGLVRLAKILGGETIQLHYSSEINSTLQHLFEASPSEELPQAIPTETDQETTPAPDPSAGSFLDQAIDFLFPVALAARQPSFAEIKKWQAPNGDTAEYLEKVRSLLDFAVTTLVIRKDLPDNIKNIYHSLIPAIAWQESCFRQFVVKDNKLTYLLSYNKSSVGIMQINERVWRGIYDTQRLRWDIKYNASAGCEIVDLYLQKYVLRKPGPTMLSDEGTLSRIIYAMYNGGPGQYSKYLQRKAGDKLYKTDTLFAQKYDWVKAQSWNNVQKCL